MDADREKRMSELKDNIRQGKYSVDPKAVADAIVRRLTELTAVGVTADARGVTASARSRTDARSSR